MSLASYDPLPQADHDDDAKSFHQPVKPKARFTRKQLLLVAFSLGIMCFAFFRFGQRAAQNQETHSQAVPHTQPQIPDHTPESQEKKGGKFSVGYFVNWGIYGRKFPPTSIPVDDLTHILYAFANLKPDTGEVHLSDTWADTDIHYPGDTWNDPGDNLYGNFKAIYKLKKAHRHLKLLLSIGGWTYSPSFHPIVIDPHKRKTFVETSIKLLEDLGIDGLDIDYEYPSNDEEAQGYVSLLKELRAALDRHAAEKHANYRFLLTIAAPCGPDHYRKLHIKEMDKYLDFWNMMAYDFAGSWDSVANHQANLFPSSSATLSVAGAIDHYMQKGKVPAHKLIIGMPLYGRSFLQTEGPSHSFSGIGPGSWEKGVYDYRYLPLPGSHMFRDEKVKASWGYDYNKHEMISFDSEEVGRWKGEWIKRKGLGGSMFWELSGDKEGAEREGIETGEGKVVVPGRSLVRVVKEAMGGIDKAQTNWLKYEKSKYENVRKGMD